MNYRGGKLHVRAPKGMACPYPGQPHKYITHSDPVFVDNDRRYRRLIMDGSLELVCDQVARIVKRKSKAKASLN